MSKYNYTIEEVRQAEEDLVDMKDKYLLRRGWTKSCEYVDSRWRWSKKHLNGMSTSDAISCQEYYDIYGEPSDEDGCYD